MSRKAGLLLVKSALSLALLYAVLSRAGASEVLSTLGGMDFTYMALAVAVYISSQYVSSVRWGLLLDGGHSRLRLFSLYMLGSFFSKFLPGLVGGDAVKAYYLYRETGAGTSALASVFMDRYIGLCSLMALGLAAYPFAFSYVRGTWVEWLLPATVLGFAVTSLVIFGFRLGRRFRLVEGVYAYLGSYARRPGVIVKASGLSVVVQLMMSAVTYLVSLGLGEEVPFLAFLVFFPIIVTVSTAPFSISGVGVREASFVLLLGTIGIRPEGAAAISLAYFLAITIGGLPGLYEYMRYKGHEKKSV